MRLVIFAIAVFLCAPHAMAQQDILSESELKFRQLQWLIGRWDRLGMKEGRRGFEEWTQKSDYLYDGIGVTTSGPDTVFVESLQIVKKNNELYYVADVPENPSPVWFQIMEVGNNYFKSENKQHNFPQHINYYNENGELRAILAGDERTVEIRFRRVN